MLFKSKYKKTIAGKLNKYLWPKGGWKRAWRYLSLRFRRLPGSPHFIALGFSIGAATAMTPFYGVHFVLGILFSWFLGASIAASIVGNFISNPWTFPLICFVSFKIGSFSISGNSSDLVNIGSVTNELSHLGHIFSLIIFDGNFSMALESITSLEIIPTIIIGSIPLSIIVGLASYFFSRKLVYEYQNRRKIKIANKLRNNNE